jgi:uncharacterized protein DUF87
MAEEPPPPWKTPALVLGWKVSKGFEPQHWDKDGARPGDHTLANVVCALPNSIAHHTVVIAQSGSGKSFFLGRLIEEILVKTSSRVLVFDPNSDFRKIGQIKSPDHWTSLEYRYNRATREGFLADEPTRDVFESRWKDITIRLHGDKEEEGAEFLPLQLDWLDFPVDILADEKATSRSDELYHCHSFVNLLARLAWETKNQEWLKYGAFLQRAHEFCRRTPVKSGAKKLLEALRTTFGLLAPGDWEDLDDQMGTSGQDETVGSVRSRESIRGIFSRDEAAIKELKKSYGPAITHRQFVSEKVMEAYFSRAFQLATAGVINLDVGNTFKKRERRRVEIVDLLSLRDRYYQKLAISSFLEADWALGKSEWEEALAKPDPKADTRVPTFIVVEEAHNLIPSDPKTPIELKLQEQFRRIAAEGRKFGRFLILISQRPDKLDRMIMSECENRAVMRVGSSFILRTTCEILGLDGVIPRMTDKVLDFDLGRALLVGPWMADEPAFLVSAARRTEEGGRSLQSKHWAQPAPKGPAASP